MKLPSQWPQTSRTGRSAWPAASRPASAVSKVCGAVRTRAPTKVRTSTQVRTPNPCLPLAFDLAFAARIRTPPERTYGAGGAASNRPTAGTRDKGQIPKEICPLCPIGSVGTNVGFLLFCPICAMSTSHDKDQSLPPFMASTCRSTSAEMVLRTIFLASDGDAPVTRPAAN